MKYGVFLKNDIFETVFSLTDFFEKAKIHDLVLSVDYFRGLVSKPKGLQREEMKHRLSRFRIVLYAYYDFVRNSTEDEQRLQKDAATAVEYGVKDFFLTSTHHTASDQIELSEYEASCFRFKKVLKSVFSHSVSVYFFFLKDTVLDTVSAAGKFLKKMDLYRPGLCAFYGDIIDSARVDPELFILYFKDDLRYLIFSPDDSRPDYRVLKKRALEMKKCIFLFMMTEKKLPVSCEKFREFLDKEHESDTGGGENQDGEKDKERPAETKVSENRFLYPF